MFYLLPHSISRFFQLSMLPLLLSLTITQTSAQAVNDVCSNAIDLGSLDGIPSVCSDGTTNFDVCVIDQNTQALGDFPYFTLPNCSGYTASQALPANDLWYRFDATTVFWFEALPDTTNGASLDSLHVSFYLGDDCNSLFALECFTVDLLNGSGTPDTLWLNDVSQGDFIYMQVSGNQLGRVGGFQINLRGCLFCPSDPMVFDPVIGECFVQSVSSIDASLPGTNDGSITVEILAGTGPFAYSWSDDPTATDSVRNDLFPGIYVVTITSGAGCEEVDSVLVEPYMPSGVQSWDEYSEGFSVFPQPAHGQMTILFMEPRPEPGNYALLDLQGRAVIRSSYPKGCERIELFTQALKDGIYFLTFSDSHALVPRMVMVRHEN